MKRFNTFLIFITALVGTSLVHAQNNANNQPLINFSVDREPLVQGEPFELEITISTKSTSDPIISLPNLAGLRILRQQESHPMSFSFSFGSGRGSQRFTERKAIYSYIVVADRPGKIHISPVEVTVDKKRFRSKSQTLNIVQSASGAAANQPAITQGPQGTQTPPLPDSLTQESPDIEGQSEEQDEIGIPSKLVDPAYFLHMSASKNEASVGEMIILYVHLYTTRSISDDEMAREPGTEDFWVENIQNIQRGRYPQEQVIVGNTRYERFELRKLALFPIKPGEVTIAPAILDLHVGRSLFSRGKKVKRSALPIKIKVLPLPTENRPPDFNKVNVGDLKFRTQVDHKTVNVGEPVTVTVSVQGEGNIRNLILPKMPEIDGFKIYAPEKNSNLKPYKSSIRGTSTSRILMIPKKTGHFKIPELSWSFYNPKQKKYITQKSKPIKIKVNAAKDEGFKGSTPQKNIQKNKDDSFDRLNRKLSTINTHAAANIENSTLTMTKPWFIALTLLAPLAYLVLIIFTQAQKKRNENFSKGRSKRAEIIATKKLTALHKQMNQLESENFFATLQTILIEFLEDRLETKVAGDTTAELKTRLVSRNFEVELAQKVILEIEGCEFARFARSSETDAERQKSLNRMEQLIKTLGTVAVSNNIKETKK